MNFISRSYLLFTISIALIFPAKREIDASVVKPNILTRKNINTQEPQTFREMRIDDHADIIIWSEDFENGENGWSLDAGWELTETGSNSPTHSVLSPNNDSNQNGIYNLLTPVLDLPVLGTDETMHFGFWLHADLPDSDGDGDDFLDDYYSISVLDVSASAWHSADYNNDSGNNFWCSDENDINGYLDSWIQYLDTPAISVGTRGEFSVRIYYAIESPDDVEVEDSCADGWDSANIRISKDGGNSWSLLEDSLYPYHFECGYGWIFNDEEYEAGRPLNHLAKGWGGDSGNWLDFSADLTDYADEEIIIRFAFGSDPAWSTTDDNTLTGFQIDAIIVTDDSGELFRDDGNDMSQMTASGEVWTDQFYDYGSTDEERPGASGWEEYLPGLPFNGNTFLNISEFAGKTIKLRIQSRYDDNHDGGHGNGLYLDDFIIYKLSSGAYFAPWSLTAEIGDSEISLNWADMNASGTADFAYENGIFSPENTITTVEGSGWAGELFDIVGPSKINTFSIYNTHVDTTISIEVYSMFGTTIDTDPTYSLEVDITPGWNDFSVTDWNLENWFVIAHEINSSFGIARDTTQTTLNAVLRLGGAWDYALNYAVIGEFGIRANISYEGAGVSYNIYRDDESLTSGLTVNSYTDSNVENNETYEYAVSAIYPDGEESSQSYPISVTPLASTIHQENYDDGTFEDEFKAGESNYSAVRFTAVGGGEDLVRFKWYQIGSGGAFLIKIFEDNEGVPGEEIFSAVQASGNEDGWNEKDLSTDGIRVSGDFWVGTKEFSSSQAFGLDIDTNSGNSFQNIGGGWLEVIGNLGYRVFLDNTCSYDCAGVCGGSAELDECGVCNGEDTDGNGVCDISCAGGVELDCAGVCGGNSVMTDFYYDEDGDGLGFGDDHQFCNSISDQLSEIGWVNNDDDEYPECVTNNVDVCGVCGGLETDAANCLGIANDIVPFKFGINEIFPNPFNPNTTIHFELSEITHTVLTIYDLNGRVVDVLVNDFLNIGHHRSTWYGTDLRGSPVSSGIYIIVLQAGGQKVQPRKMVLLK